jgi:predicted flap endonuclease-1-like 5' DNA nuclease
MEETNEMTVDAEIRDPKAVLDALDRAKKEAKTSRMEKDELAAKLESTSTQLESLKSGLIGQKAAAKLNSLGVVNAERILKYVDLAKVELDNEFNLTNFDEQVDQIKGDFPELFDPKLRVAGLGDTGNKSISVQLTASELQARAILGK